MSIRRAAKNKIVVCGAKTHQSKRYSSEVIRTMILAGEHHGLEHARWRDLAPEYQEHCFAVIRNPWDRTVSRWQFGVVAEGKNYSFREFLKERNTYGGREYFWHRAIRGWYPQADYVTDESGKIRVDCLRFATGDVEEYLHLRKLPKHNATGHKYYQEYYGTEEIEIVADWYKRDIDLFGFSFDSAATRNIWMPSL